MRLYSIIITFFILALSSCVLKHDPASPTMTFKVGPAYTSANATIDTAASILIGFSATKNTSIMRYLQVTRAIDTLSPALLNTYILIDSEANSINRDFSFKAGKYLTNTTETYTFKISDDEGYTFQKAISFTVHP